jgi:hypothetical protein
MRESFNPALAATVAAPMWKLWPLKWESSMPTALKASRSARTKCVLDSVALSWNIKSGPGTGGRMARYPSNAATGQIDLPVAPRCKLGFAYSIGVGFAVPQVHRHMP